MHLSLIPLLVLTAEPTTPPGPTWPVALQSQVITATKAFEGELALYVKDLRTGVEYGYNAKTPMYLASTVKLPVLIELFSQVKAGTVSLEDSVTYGEENLRDGSIKVSRAEPGTTYTFAELARLMMTESDNGATDLILGRIGIDNVNARLQAFDPRFRRLTTMLDVRRHVYAHLSDAAMRMTPQQVYEVRRLKALPKKARRLSKMLEKEKGFWRARDLQNAWTSYYASELNSAPMEAMGALLEKLAEKTLVGEDASTRMIDIMLGCKTGARRLRGLLPPHVELAHKTGTQLRRACNVGILYVATNRPVVVAACTKEFKALGLAEKVLAKIGKAIFDAIEASPLSEPDAEPTSKPTDTPVAAATQETTESSEPQPPQAEN
ncbi:MAG: serine hydrolase [Myxococcota bacterium]